MATKQELAKAALEYLANQKAALDAQAAANAPVEVSDVVPETADVVSESEDAVMSQPETVPVAENQIPALQDDIVNPDVAKAVAKMQPRELPTVQTQPTAIPATIAAPSAAPAVMLPTIPATVPTATVPQDIGQVQQIVTAQPEMAAKPAPVPQRPSVLLPPEQQPTPQPTLAQEAEAYKKQAEPIQKAKAQVNAAKKIQDELANDQKRLEEQQKNVQQKLQDEEKEVRFKSLPEIMQTGSLGEKFSVALAIMLGGVSQGLLGTKTNPAIDLIDKLVEQQATKDKLDASKTAALKEAAYKEGMLKVEQAKQQTNDYEAKKKYEMLGKQLNAEADKLSAQRLLDAQQKEAAFGMYNGKALSKEQQMRLTDKQREHAAFLPDIPGLPKRRLVLLNDPKGKDQLDAARTSNETIQTSLQRLKKIQSTIGFFGRLDPATRAEIEAIRLPLSAALRIPYTGPGPLVEKERELLYSATANPADFADAFISIVLKSPEKAKLDVMQEMSYLMLNNAAKTQGILEPVVPVKMYNDNGQVKTEKLLLLELQKANPGVPENILLAKIRKMAPAD